MLLQRLIWMPVLPGLAHLELLLQLAETCQDSPTPLLDVTAVVRQDLRGEMKPRAVWVGAKALWKEAAAAHCS
jgi:hypothetical protein